MNATKQTSDTVRATVTSRKPTRHVQLLAILRKHLEARKRAHCSKPIDAVVYHKSPAPVVSQKASERAEHPPLPELPEPTPESISPSTSDKQDAQIILSPDAYLSEGREKMIIGDYDLAMKDFDFAIASAKNSHSGQIAHAQIAPEAELSKAEALISLGKFNEAVFQAQKAIESSSPSNSVSMSVRAANLSATAHIKSGDYESAEKDLARAFSTLDANLSLDFSLKRESLLVRSELSISKSNYSESIKDLSLLLKREPENLRALHLMVTAHKNIAFLPHGKGSADLAEANSYLKLAEEIERKELAEFMSR